MLLLLLRLALCAENKRGGLRPLPGVGDAFGAKKQQDSHTFDCATECMDEGAWADAPQVLLCQFVAELWQNKTQLCQELMPRIGQTRLLTAKATGAIELD